MTDSLTDLDLAEAQRRNIAAALDLLPMVIAKMTAILDDPRASATARVQAARTIGEIAGAVGRERQPKVPLPQRPLDELSYAELVIMARRGDEALTRLGPKLAIDNTPHNDPLT